MKKTVSVIMVLVIVFSFFSIIFAFAENEEITLEEYSSQLSELTKTYGIESIGGITEGTNLSEISLNRLIVKTTDNNSLEEDFGAVAKIEGYDGIHVLQYTSTNLTNQAYEEYIGLPNVEFVEYDFAYQSLEPETEYIEYEYNKKYLSWGSTAVKVNEAVMYANYLDTDAQEIVVAVIDTGIDADHSFFHNRLINSGIDLVENDKNPDDDHGHGTHVAGIIVDNTAENVKISGYKTIDYEGNGYYSITCAAIEEAITDDVDIINMSLRWKKTKECYNLFEEKIQKAVNNGISVVVGSGNENINASMCCPASNNDVITVAATTIANIPWAYSNYGDCVDIAAPGENIRSTIPGGLKEEKSGTSMATPFVSAAAAFLKTLNPNYSPETIKNIIKENVFIPENWNTDYGTGILDFSKIVSKCISPYPKITLNANKKAEISTEVEDAIIYYTINNSKPIPGVSSVYSEPIDITEAISIKAIVVEKDKFPSTAATLKINWSEDITIRYKETKNLLLPPNRRISLSNSSNSDVVSVNSLNQTIYGVSIGNAKVTVYLSTGQKVTYNVTVEYALWQEILIYFFFGFLWYI